MRKTVTIGLRTATKQEIKELITQYEKRGYTVEHKTENTPFNGVLIAKR